LVSWGNDLILRILMSEEQHRILKQQLWNIANELRGNMGADEFRDYIL
jgi:type I restriction enzyme M protein